MKRTKIITRRLALFAITLLLPVALVACGGDQQSTDEMSHDEAMQTEGMDHEGMNRNGMSQEGMVQEESDAVRAAVEDGEMQTIEVEATMRGFQPQHVILQEGMTTAFTVTRRTSSACLEQIQIPAFDIEKTDLPLNEPVTFEFTPDRTGTFEFVCGMDMQHGTIVVES